jgi:4-hydroxybenzoate polyprenyltransferase
MLRRLFASIGGHSLSVQNCGLAILGICSIRFVLECFSSTPDSLVLERANASIFIENTLFFLAAALGCACLLKALTKNAPNIASLTAFGICAILIAPIVDLISAGPDGARMTYIVSNAHELWSRYFTFFIPHGILGVTPGMQLELLVVYAVLFSFVYIYRSSWVAVVLVVPSVHFYLYMLISLLSLVALATGTVSLPDDPTDRDYFAAIKVAVDHSVRARATVSLQETVIDVSTLFKQILFLVCVAFGAVWFWLDKRTKFYAVLKNSRFERVLFYISFLFIGGWFAQRKLSMGPMTGPDILGFVVLLLSWYAAWMFSVHINDIHDESLDRVNSPSRPLISGILSVDELRQSAWVWLSIALVGGITEGNFIFVCLLAYIACYYVYSAPPLRLKRIPIVSSFLISIAVLSTLTAGFFYCGPNFEIGSLPHGLVLAILLIFTLGVNVRDLKDIEGDKMHGMRTIPVLCGKYGREVVGLLFSIPFLLVPVVLQWHWLFAVSIPAAIAGYVICTRKPYNEKWVFALFFGVLFSIGFMFLGAQSMGLPLPVVYAQGATNGVNTAPPIIFPAHEDEMVPINEVQPVAHVPN